MTMCLRSRIDSNVLTIPKNRAAAGVALVAGTKINERIEEIRVKQERWIE